MLFRFRELDYNSTLLTRNDSEVLGVLMTILIFNNLLCLLLLGEVACVEVVDSLVGHNDEGIFFVVDE